MIKNNVVEKLVVIENEKPTAHDVEVAMSIMAVNPVTNYGIGFICGKTKALKAINEAKYLGHYTFPSKVRGVSVDETIAMYQNSYGIDNVMVLDESMLDTDVEQEPDFTPEQVEAKLNEMLKSAPRTVCAYGYTAPWLDAEWEPGTIRATFMEYSDSRYAYLNGCWSAQLEPNSSNVWTMEVGKDRAKMPIADFAKFYCSIAEESNLAERYRKYMNLEEWTRNNIIGFGVLLGEYK